MVTVGSLCGSLPHSSMVFIATWHVPCSPKGHMVHKAEPQSMQAAQEQDALLLSRVWLGCVCARVHVHMHACGMVLLLIRALSAACIGLNACMGALRNSFLAMQPCTTAPLHPCPASVWLCVRGLLPASPALLLQQHFLQLQQIFRVCRHHRRC